MKKESRIPYASKFEEKHLINIMLYLITNGPSRKIYIYQGVSSNPRMPDKINSLESMGLVNQDMDDSSRSTIVSLTKLGMDVAKLLEEMDKLLRIPSEKKELADY